MKNVKRILSLIIVLTMCFSLLPTSAFAEEGWNSWDTGGSLADQIVACALAQIGKNDSNLGVPSGLPWCAWFVMKCAEKVGVAGSAIPAYGYGKTYKASNGKYYGVTYAFALGVAIAEDFGGRKLASDEIPKTGDVVVFDGNHVGIMINSQDTISGNLDNQVYRATVANLCKWNKWTRVEYYRPNYQTELGYTLEHPQITNVYDSSVTYNSAVLNARIEFPENCQTVDWGLDIGPTTNTLTNISFVEGFNNHQPALDHCVSYTDHNYSYNVRVDLAKDAKNINLMSNMTFHYWFWVQYIDEFGKTQYAHSEIKSFRTPQNAPSFTEATVTIPTGGSANDVKISSKIEWTADALPIDWGVDLQNANGDWENVGVNFSNKISATRAGNIKVSLNFANETIQANMLQAGRTYNYRLWVQYRDTINNTTDFHHSAVGTFTAPGSTSSETTYPLAFNANGGSACNTLNVILGQEFFIPTSTKSGYTLNGWTAKRTVGSTETWHVAGKGWYTEAQITSSGYVKEVYTPSRTPTFNTGWTGGNTNATFTFYAVWKENVTSVAVTGVSLNKSSLSLTAGKSEKLTATVSPSNATNKNVTWTSSDSAVATVASDGTVTAVKAGTATITAKTADGNKTASCTVTVTALTPPSFSDISITNITDSSATLHYTINYASSNVPKYYGLYLGTSASGMVKVKLNMKQYNENTYINSTNQPIAGTKLVVKWPNGPITGNSIAFGSEGPALVAGTTYYYKLWITDASGNTEYCSNTQSFQTTGSSPTASKTLTFNGHTYERYDSSITWTEAKSFCEARGGHLVTITTAAEQDKVKELLSGCTKNYYWIGASDAASEGTWTWVTGETFWTGGMNGSARSGFVAYWDTDAPEPNDREGENYAGIMGKNVGTRKQIGEWIDVYNGGDTGNDDYALSKSGFICEYEPQKPDTPTVTTDKSSYTQGENVTISWTTAARNEYYVLRIYKDGASLYSGSQGQSTTYTLSKPAVGSYEVLVTANNTGGASGQARCTFTVEPVKYRLDLNAVLDGEKNTSLGGYGVVDVYINGQLVQSSCSDYSTSWPAGTSYEFKNIRPADGRSYDGLSTQAGEGISSSARAGSVNDYRDVRLVFHTCPDSIDETPVTAVYNGHSYRFFSTPVTWYDAKHLCEAMGGHLATVTSAEENTFLNTLANGESYWLGGTDRDHEGVWTWITGEAFTYSDWNEYQPDNAKSAAEGSENYLHHLSSMGHWNDNYGSGTYPFVCEYDFVLSYPVVYDANGGTVAPTDQSKLHGTALTLTSDVPTRASVNVGNYTVTLDPNGGSVNSETLTAACTMSYRFKNWNDKADGSGTSYAPGESYTLNEALVLYAQWEKGESVAAVMLPTPMREGYDFVGWVAIDEGMTGVTGSYTPSDDVTLYAVWAKPDFVMPALLTNIEEEAFAGGAFTYVKLPENAVSIGWHAFADCPNLTYIYIPALTKQIDDQAFGSNQTLTIIGKTGTTAESYAKNHNFTFIAVP